MLAAPRPGRSLPIGKSLAALVAIGLAVQAATTLVSESTIATGVVSPPAQFEAGSNADDRRWFKSFSLSTNKTSFSAEVKPRAGSHVYIEDVVKLKNTDDETRTITLTGSTVDNANVQRFGWELFEGDVHVAQLDHTAADPSASFDVAAGNSVQLDLEIDLADGSGRTNAGISFEVQLEVT